jgi:hypothetical protein
MPDSDPQTKTRVYRKSIALRVLLKNKRACCICHQHKEVHLHHIDGNAANTVEQNLAVLCFDHHDQATAGLVKGQTGLGVKLSPEEVRMHKMAWEATVAREHTISLKNVPQRKRQQLSLLFEFEMTKIKNEILAFKDKKVTETRMRFLSEFLIEEFLSRIPYRNIILEGINDIVVLTGEHTITVPLVSALINFHLHLVGPEKVKLDRKDRVALMKTLEILGHTGFYGVAVNYKTTLLRLTCNLIEELCQIASWYRYSHFMKRSKDVLSGFRKEWEDLSPREKKSLANKRKLGIIKRAQESVRLMSNQKLPQPSPWLDEESPGR